MKELDRLCAETGIPGPVKEGAVHLYKVAIDGGFARGYNALTLIAASLYAACREGQIPITLRELARASDEKSSRIGKCYRKIIEATGITVTIADPATYVRRIASNAHKSQDAIEFALEMIRSVRRRGIYTGGRNPGALAGAALYLACLKLGKHIRQGEVADAAGVGVVSLRKSTRLLRKLLNHVL